MDFADEVRQLAGNVSVYKDSIQTEEATKISIVMPLLKILGYNIFDPTEVIPEFTADVGIKKGEKVDYALVLGGRPIILIEVKCLGTALNPHTSQLFRYFSTEIETKFGVLTDGLTYQFYSDLDQKNVMDTKPFLSLTLSSEIRDSEISELKKFHKDTFDPDKISSTAVQLKYSGEIRKYLKIQLENPEEDFLRFFIRKVHSGNVTAKVIEAFGPVVGDAFRKVINEMVGDRLKDAIEGVKQAETEEVEIDVEPSDGIITTEEEIEAFHIIRAIMSKHTHPENIVYKDTKSYFSINFQGNTWKWLCRLKLTTNQKSIMFRGQESETGWRQLDSLTDLYGLEDEFGEALKIVSGEKRSDEKDNL